MWVPDGEVLRNLRECGGGTREDHSRLQKGGTCACRTTYAGSRSFFRLGLEDGHVPTFYPLLKGGIGGYLTTNVG